MYDPSKYKLEFISKEKAIFWLASFTLMSFLIVALNLATILTFVSNRYLRRRSVYCLINLTIADLLYGITGAVYGFCVYGFISMNLDMDPTFSIFVFLCIACTFLASALSLAIVSLERVCAFFFPFRHRVIRQRVYIGVFVVSWVIAIIATWVFKVLSNPSALILFYFVVTLSVIIIFSSYAAIFIKLKKNSPQEFQNQTSFSQRRQIQEKKLAKTLFIATALSIITCMPYVAYRFSYLHMNQDTLLLTHPNVYSLMYIFQRMNSVVNPIVYLFRMRDFRKALFQVVFRCSCTSRVNAYPVVHRNEII
ncbi:cannabinoid receptor type 1A-like [Actinia tenebrosa]|uniref:Cannabinoid receptor type 1A-like n=1 Tax=Actinia tenebrosa TaxID=6105 RepID=A0A6P8IKI9_ACTTE|nr:cannabinoid receptor type 1A-like [Actinia tenebrosa]